MFATMKALILFAGFALLFQISRAESSPDTVVYSKWMGFSRTDFIVAGRNCLLVEPNNPAPGNPWIWRTEFFGHEPQADSVLLTKGYYVAYIDVQDMYGSPQSIKYMDAFYKYLKKHKKLNKKATLEGFSRGGLFALNWAAKYPKRTACIYLDAPVCDFKNWPGTKGKGPGSIEDWNKMKKSYGFSSDEEALNYKYNPVDNLKPIAKYKIPILSVCGGKDIIVPVEENSGLVKERYEKLGGKMELIIKKDVGHHPHSLEDPTPIVEFIMRYALK